MKKRQRRHLARIRVKGNPGKRGKNRVHHPLVLDNVFANEEKHVKRYAEKHGKSLKEALAFFKKLKKRHKRVKREALKQKHLKAGTWIPGSQERREAKRREEYLKNKALRDRRIAFAKAASTYSSVDDKGKKKIPFAVIVNPNAPQASTMAVRSVSMSGASSLPLAA